MKFLSLILLLLISIWVEATDTPKYIFLFIGDGMSTPQRMLADEFSRFHGKGKLAINALPHHATTRTSSANAVITDSAASGTAIACGEKTNNGMLGLNPQGKKLESIAVFAKKRGYKVGIITSITINHATPASFYAQRPNRKQYYDIALDMINSKFDYFGGGGFGGRLDGDKGNLFDLATRAGFIILDTPEKIKKQLPTNKTVYALAARNNSLPLAIDGVKGLTLADFTAKGIELLNNPNGFFIMVEGGQIDTCGHYNDIAGNIRETLAFDDSVKVALKFAEKYPKETLIVVTGDHETGGLALGSSGSVNIDFQLLAKQRISMNRFKLLLEKKQKVNPKFTFEDAKKMLTEYFGFQFSGKGRGTLKPDEIANLKQAFDKKQLHIAATKQMAKSAGLRWSSTSHTSLSVLTTSQGCGAEKITGFIENSDIAIIIKSLIN